MSPVALASPTPEAPSKQGFRVTGRLVLAILLGWFAFVGSVNAIMMTLAVKTLPATVVSSPYKVGNAYNKDIAAARAQEARHWVVDMSVQRAADGLSSVSLVAHDGKGKALPGNLFTLSAIRPADGRDVVTVPLAQNGAERVSGQTRALEPGLWEMTLEAHDPQSRERLYLSVSRIVLK